MPNADRQKVTFNLPRDLVRSYRVAAARQGLRDQDLVEAALRKHLGIDGFKKVQRALAGIARSARSAERIAVEEVRAVRSRRR
jgi:hypothetical protein